MVHPLMVAHILAGMRMDLVTIETGFLHDLVEDTRMTPDEIRKGFGEERTERKTMHQQPWGDEQYEFQDVLALVCSQPGEIWSAGFLVGGTVCEKTKSAPSNALRREQQDSLQGQWAGLGFSVLASIRCDILVPNLL